MSAITPLLIKLTILTLFLLLHSATSSYPSHSSPSPSPSPSPSSSASHSRLHESPISPSPSPSSSPTKMYSPPAPPSQSHSPASVSAPTPSDDAPTPAPVAESVTNDKTMNIVTEEANKKSSGGNGVGLAFGLIGAACLVIFGGSVYKKRRDNIRRSRRYSAANIQLI